MSFDYFSKNRVQYILTKLKDIFDTKANISDVPDTFADLTDVEITSPVSGQIPVYNPTTGKWVNGRRIIFSTADPAVNIGSELDVYIKISSNDYGKSFRVYTTSTGSENASIAVDTIISGEVTRTDAIVYRSPGRTYSDFTTNYYGGNWRVNITTDNVDSHPRGEEIAWAYYASKNLSLIISPPIIYGVYIKSNGIWVNCKDTPISTFADLTDTAFTNLQNGQVAIYNSTTGKWENGNVSSANDGVLTIQKNGTTVQTFSANQSTDVTANITVPTTATDVGAIPTTQKGVASGVAELDANGKVPSSQLPSYVDDTIEGYLYEGHWYSDAEHTQEVVGETGKIYVELSTNKAYRWSGTTFVEISESLALGETSSTAYRGDRGATAYSHATDANKVSSATATGLYKVGATAEGHISELQAVQKSDITNLGIPGAVKLTITVSESEDPQTGDEVLVANKTPSEVLAALNGGVVVEAVYEGRVCSIAQNLLSSDGRILFGVTVGGDNVGLFFNGLMFIKDSQDDAWESITLMNSHATQRLNASIDYSNNTYSCDYTYDEFESARSNGQEILVEYDNVIYYFTKYDSSEYTYYFSSTLADSDGTAINTFVMVGDDSTGDWDSITLTESSGGSASSFLVRVYEDPQTQQTTCDKLPSEILAAYTNGSIIQAKIELEGEDAMLDLASCLLSSSPYLVIFSTLVTRQNDDTVTLSLHLQKDSSSDTWEDIDIYQSDLCHYVGNISHDTNGYYFDITPSKFDDAISYSLGARIKYEDSDNDVTYDFYLSRYDTSDSEHTVFYLTSVNADSTGETTILTFALYPDWELDYWDNIVLYETNGTGDVIWTGTQAEYNAQASQIPVGAYVNITDDEQIIPYASAIRWEEAKTSVKKNLLPSDIVSQTKNGLTFTVNSDKSVTVSGTASAITVLEIGNIDLKAGVQYILSGGVASDHTHLDLRKNNVTWTANTSGKAVISPKPSYGIDTFTPSADDTVTCCIRIANGEVITTPITFYPMIRLSSIVDDTYVPYIPDNTELVDWKSNSVLGTKNLLPNLADSGITTNGVTMTVNSDGSITFNGTATANSDFIIVRASDFFAPPKGNYIFSTNVDNSNIQMRVEAFNGTTWVKFITAAVSPASVNLDYVGYTNISASIRVNSGVTLNNVTFKPMLRLASDTDTTYQPYAKTNQILTKDVLQKVDWTGASTSVKKNYINGNKPIGDVTTINGLTFTVNSDKSVTINGTATAVTDYVIAGFWNNTNILVPSNSYTLSLGASTVNAHITIKAIYVTTVLSSTYTSGTFNAPNGITEFFIRVDNGAVINNVTVHPMLRLASVEDDTYVPYIPDNTELLRYSDNNILGAKNVMPVSMRTNTYNGITFTVNSDNTITLNGTATSSIYRTIFGDGVNQLDIFKNGEEYILSGSPLSGVSSSDCYLYINGTPEIRSAGGEETKFRYLSSVTRNKVAVFINNGTQLNNVILKPMIRFAFIKDSTYVPYAMTNRQLTELAPVWTSSVSALTGATSVTITNANIHTSSVIEPFADNGTNTAMSMPTMIVTEGQCVLGFDALTANTTFKLRITN